MREHAAMDKETLQFHDIPLKHRRWPSFAGTMPLARACFCLIVCLSIAGERVLNGARTVVEAVAHSKKVAEAMHAYIQSQVGRGE